MLHCIPHQSKVEGRKSKAATAAALGLYDIKPSTKATRGSVS